METKALAIIPRDLAEVNSLAEVLAKSNLLPDALKGKVPDVVVSILTGQELGLTPMAAIRGVYVVGGKPVLSADLMVGLCLGSGLCEYFTCVEDTATSQTYETKRKGSPHPQRLTWTMEDAKRGALNLKDNWRLFPRSMLKARCRAMLARDVFPDVLAGCYDPDELHVPAVQCEVIEDAEVVSCQDELAVIEECQTIDELKALSKKLAALREPLKAQARERYTAKLTQLESA